MQSRETRLYTLKPLEDVSLLHKNVQKETSPKNMGGKRVDELDIFNKLKIGVASDEKVREWSKGEVKKPETIN